MKKSWLAGLAALALLLFAVSLIMPLRPRLSSLRAFAALADQAATVGDFMQVVHGPNGLRMQIQGALRGSGPADDKAWRAVEARAAILCLLTTAILETAQPEKGSLDSWKTQVAEYKKVTESLSLATRAKNRRASFERVTVLARSCKSCHRAHK